MTELEIKSTLSDTSLRFSDMQGDHFLVTLESFWFKGAVIVWAYDVPVRLFESLARDWRGWTGKRS